MRLLIAGGLVVVLALILVSSIRGCRRDNLVDSYRTYLAGANQIADDSASLGTDLRVVLENKAGKNPKEITPQLTEFGARANEHLGRAEQLEPPDGLREPHKTFITALEYRRDAFAELPSAVAAAIKTSDAANGAATLGDPLKALGTSDVIFERSYRRPAQKALQADAIKDVQINPSEIFPGNNANIYSPAGAQTAWNNLRRVGTPVTAGTDGTARRGLGIVQTFAVRSSGQRIQLQPGATVPIPAGDITFEVTVQNGGETIESGIDVTVTYSTPINAQAKTEKKTIETIEPGEDNQVTLTFAGPDPYTSAPSKVLVVVSEVQDETRTSNNKATYPINFTISG